MTEPAIIFDFGNVLVKWDLHAIYDRFFPDPSAVEAFLREVSFLEWNSRMDSGETFASAVADISRTYPHYAHLFRLYDERWLDTLRKPIVENVALVKKLKEAGYPLCLLSNISAEKFPLAREIHPFLNLFNVTVISGEVGMIKPGLEIFLYTLGQLGRSPDACIFVDDNPANVESARKVGIASILYRSTDQLKNELKGLGIL